MTGLQEKGRIRRGVPVGESSRDGCMAIDMHVHTTFSDARIRVSDLLTYAKRLNIGLAITDHNEIGGVLAAYRENHPVPVIPGIEVSAAEGPHILLYFPNVQDLESFYSDHILKNKGGSPFMAIRLTTAEILDAASRYDCIRAAAHPFGYSVLNRGLIKCIRNGLLPEELAGKIDAWEVVNGGLSPRLNRSAIEFAEERGYGIIGGSDAHLLQSVGTVCTFARAEGIREFLASVRDGKTRVSGIEAGSVRKMLTAGIIGAKFLPYTLPSLRVHYRQNARRIGSSLQRLFR